MSEFEFVQVTFAIILGLGVTSILSSIAEQLNARHTHAVFGLQLFAQSVLLLLLLIQLWGFWVTQDTEWDIGIFLFHAVSPLCFAIAAHATRVDVRPGAASVRDQYISNARVVYGFWMVASVFGVALTFFYARQLDVTLMETAPLIALRVLGAAALVVMLLSKNARIHWCCLALLLATLSSVLLAFFFELE